MLNNNSNNNNNDSSNGRNRARLNRNVKWNRTHVMLAGKVHMCVGVSVLIESVCVSVCELLRHWNQLGLWLEVMRQLLPTMLHVSE